MWLREPSIRRIRGKSPKLVMAEELAFKDEAAAEYDRAFAHVTAEGTNPGTKPH
jgi:hypothetical protein